MIQLGMAVGLVSTAQHSTAQHSTAQHITAQHSTAQTHRCKGVNFAEPVADSLPAFSQSSKPLCTGWHVTE